MSNRDTALRFIELFCAADLSGLAQVLAADLHVVGPLYEFGSREEYLNSLREDPPEPGACTVLSILEDNETVTVFYDYQKAHQTLTIAQLFTFRDRTIVEILLVFDTGAFLRR
jgi:hypothetical protein